MNSYDQCRIAVMNSDDQCCIGIWDWYFIPISQFRYLPSDPAHVIFRITIYGTRPLEYFTNDFNMLHYILKLKLISCIT